MQNQWTTVCKPTRKIIVQSNQPECMRLGSWRISYTKKIRFCTRGNTSDSKISKPILLQPPALGNRVRFELKLYTSPNSSLHRPMSWISSRTFGRGGGGRREYCYPDFSIVFGQNFRGGGGESLRGDPLWKKASVSDLALSNKCSIMAKALNNQRKK